MFLPLEEEEFSDVTRPAQIQDWTVVQDFFSLQSSKMRICIPSLKKSRSFILLKLDSTHQGGPHFS